MAKCGRRSIAKFSTTQVTLKHLNTNCFLALHHQHTFQRGHGGGDQLMGNAEVACVASESDATQWRAGEGVYVAEEAFEEP